MWSPRKPGFQFFKRSQEPRYLYDVILIFNSLCAGEKYTAGAFEPQSAPVPCEACHNQHLTPVCGDRLPCRPPVFVGAASAQSPVAWHRDSLLLLCVCKVLCKQRPPPLKATWTVLGTPPDRPVLAATAWGRLGELKPMSQSNVPKGKGGPMHFHA